MYSNDEISTRISTRIDRSLLRCFHNAVSKTMRTFHAPEVGKLPDHRKSKGNVCLLEPWWGVQWMVEEVSNKCSKAPIVCAVLEEVPQRHSAMTEPAIYRTSSSGTGRQSLSAQGLHVSKLTDGRLRNLNPQTRYHLM